MTLGFIIFSFVPDDVDIASVLVLLELNLISGDVLRIAGGDTFLTGCDSYK